MVDGDSETFVEILRYQPNKPIPDFFINKCLIKKILKVKSKVPSAFKRTLLTEVKKIWIYLAH